MFPDIRRERDDALAEKWRKIRTVRRVITGALEFERAGKRIGSSLEADPMVHMSVTDLFAALVDVDLAEVCITSAATLFADEGPADAFRLPLNGAWPSSPSLRKAHGARAPGRCRRRSAANRTIRT